MSKQKKYHFIYKTTCKVTGKFYVGMHSTDNLEDGYLGSGKILGYSRKKYGDENHVREIVDKCLSRDELKQRERDIVNEDLLKDPLNINLKYGGEGGWSELSKEQRSFLGKIGGFSNRHLWSNETKIKVKRALSISCTKNNIDLWANHREKMLNGTRKAAIAALSNSSKIKRKETLSSRRPHDGEKNSQFGTCWVTNGVKPIKIKKENLDEYLLNGYSRGRI